MNPLIRLSFSLTIHHLIHTRFVTLAFSLLLFTSSLHADMVLVEKGASLAPVIVPENPTMFTRLAAQELAEHLGRIGGAKVAVTEGAPATTPDSAIWVGLQPRSASCFPTPALISGIPKRS